MNAIDKGAAGVELDLLAAGREEPEQAQTRLRSAHQRGWLVRRALVCADVTSLVAAYLLAKLITEGFLGTPKVGPELAVLVLMLPAWIIAAKVYGLYERDEEHVDHSTVDEIVGVLNLVTLGAWFYFVATWIAGAHDPHVARLLVFWLLAAVLVTTTRGAARTFARRCPMYLQNTLILGAGHIGQLAARKLLQHPEYGINLLGFVDANPRPRRSELEHLPVLGPPDRLLEIVGTLRVERVIVAFSEAAHEESLRTIRALRQLDLQIDVVPRLFEIVGPRADIHTLEGLSLVGLTPARISPSSRLLKRTIDYVVALAMLIVFSPLMLLTVIAIRFDSAGPVLFRQRRLGLDMRPFTVLKFRTMRVDTDEEEHRRYIESTLTDRAAPNGNGLYKLDRSDSITRVGRWLRKTSLDELPQLFNILAGDMSLVGPRPCLDYETEGFAEHHFERFLMPPGLTGLWQVTARAKSTFAEALEMDVEYVRGWSLGLDLHLLLKTPFSLFRMRATA